MKTNPDNHDDTLRSLLKEWRTDIPLPPRFQENVWRRIESAEVPSSAPSVWAVISHWIGNVLPRPALAVSYMTVLLAIGATVGWAQGRGDTAKAKADLGGRYVRALDPYQTPRQ